VGADHPVGPGGLSEWTAVTQALSMRGAQETAARAGIDIRMLEEVEELTAADGLLARIWRSDDGLMGVNVLKALSHSGHYVAGAWRHEELVGVSVAWGWGPGRPGALHSHITGVDPDLQGRGAGLALKMHQAAWALAHGIHTITWTFDPMVRRNAWFNLVKLRARGESYHPDFYGPMTDGVNGGELTDRCFVVWRLPPPDEEPAAPDRWPAGRAEAPDGEVILHEAPGGRPEVGTPVGRGPERWPPRLLCQVPSDALSLRAGSPDLARDWRLALRATMGRVMAAGYHATSMTPDGYYVLERGDDEQERIPR
jgi:predicted GNAT superfamily acetyltransferase